jgi:copper resistance protein B
MTRLLALLLATTTLAGAALAQTAADDYYDPREMAAARHMLRHHHGGTRTYFVEGERLEYHSGEGEPLFVWDGQGWFGGDRDKLWLKTEGEYDVDGEVLEEAELQALYSRAIGAFFDAQVGLRSDLGEGPDRTYGVIGMQGLAPYFFEVDAAMFVSDRGDVTARVEGEYELLLTQRLILQPRTELEFAAQDVAALDIGAGLSTAELGVRLRYEIVRQFAPYVGVSWTRDVGRTEDLARADGRDPSVVSFVAGVRFWF